MARDHPEGRGAAYTRIIMVTIAQVFWCLSSVIHLPLTASIIAIVFLYALELSAPVVGERKGALPWNVHHLTERFGLLVIIALGEGILGTFTAVQVATDSGGWSVDAIVVLFSGVTMTFGMWWVYFITPTTEMLTLRRNRMIPFSYGHLPIYMSIAAVGAGLHVAALFVEGHSSLGIFGTVLAVVIPIAIFIGIVYAAWPFMMEMPAYDPLHVWTLIFTALVLGGALVMAAFGVGIAWCLSVAMLAPWASVIGYETVGNLHVAEQLSSMRENTAG